MPSSLFIKQFINFPVSSNCFIISSGNNCLLVDPACGKGEAIENYLSENNLQPKYIILTHEHFDHISSVEHIRARYHCKVIASAVCSESIGNPKKNLSLFYDQQGFSCKPADILIEHDYTTLTWNEFVMQFHLTPGHSAGGICFSINNHLFTGDTLMNEYKPVVKLPGGDRKTLAESLKRVVHFYNDQIIVHPGHGAPFFLKDISN